MCVSVCVIELCARALLRALYVARPHGLIAHIYKPGDNPMVGSAVNFKELPYLTDIGSVGNDPR
jgi:hypothetical protein